MNPLPMFRTAQILWTFLAPRRPSLKVAASLCPTLTLCSLLLSSPLFAADSAPKDFLKGHNRVVFAGDSITYDGRYIVYLEAYLRTRFPDRSHEFLNIGLPSETTSGLSEDGHAGGAFPRPALRERLQRLLDKAQPDLLIACYGMNDGIYLPPDPTRLRAFQNGIEHLRATAQNAKVPVLHLTPICYDYEPVRPKKGPAGPAERYDETLGEFSAWLLNQRTQGWNVLDLRTPTRRYLDTRRKSEPQFALAGDGVHIGAMGHWLIAQQLLSSAFRPDPVDSTRVFFQNDRSSRSPNIQISEQTPQRLKFRWTTRLPLPLDPKLEATPADRESIRQTWNRRVLAIRNLPEGSWQLSEGDTVLGQASAQTWRNGVDLSAWNPTSLTRNAETVLAKLQQKHALLKDAWLSHVGHLRPGMGKGKPLDVARSEASTLDAEIAQLCKDASIELTLVPAPKPSQP